MTFASFVPPNAEAGPLDNFHVLLDLPDGRKLEIVVASIDGFLTPDPDHDAEVTLYKHDIMFSWLPTGRGPWGPIVSPIALAENCRDMPEPVGQETCISPAGVIEQPYKRVDALADDGVLVLAEGKGCVKVHNPDGSTFPAITSSILTVPALDTGGSC